jgi:2,3-bisphosphoglycerate-independent phosphoglycerate mutase
MEDIKAGKIQLAEAEYQGRNVKLGKPMQGDVKKFKVYVKNEKGNVVKVNFGQKGMSIKKNDPERRRSFRARHNCDNPGPRDKARYWSCRKW